MKHLELKRSPKQALSVHGQQILETEEDDVVTSDSGFETKFSDPEEHSDNEEQTYNEQSYEVRFVFYHN